VQSNMVFARLDGREEALKAFLRERGILVGGYGELRFVTHLDIDDAAIERTLAACRGFTD